MNSETKPQPPNLPTSQVMTTSNKALIFSALREIARGIVVLFPPGFCEVVIHDLTDLEHSVVYIEGDVTNRTLGSPMTNAGVKALRDDNLEQLLGYVTRTPDGKTLRCSAPFLKDDEGKYYASMCINVDVSLLSTFQSALSAIIPPCENEVSEAFSTDIEDLLARMLQKATTAIGKPVNAMSRVDRLRVVENLEREGAFRFRNAVPMIANFLGVSRSTIYNYLKEVTRLSESLGLAQPEANGAGLGVENRKLLKYK